MHMMSMKSDRACSKKVSIEQSVCLRKINRINKPIFSSGRLHTRVPEKTVQSRCLGRFAMCLRWLLSRHPRAPPRAPPQNQEATSPKYRSTTHQCN
jgi:hypothetical protein